MQNKSLFKRSLLAAALALAFPATSVLADEVDDLINPNIAEIGFGMQYLNAVNPLYRQYTGTNHQGVNGVLDINFVQRSDEGRWFKLDAHNLGLSTQEIAASIEMQGDWAVTLGYDQIPRYAPYKVNTPVTGIGTNSLNLPASFQGTGASFYETDLKTERTATSLSASKYILEGLQVNFSFKHEDKKGTRMSGSGGNNVNANDPISNTSKSYSTQFFTPEPIDSNHQQLEASLNYYSKQFQLSGGYYGSFFKNNAGTGLFVSPGSESATGSTLSSNMTALSLAPDNQMQQFYVSGAYNWSESTRANLKFSKSFAEQKDDFLTAAQIVGTTADPLTTRSNLGAKLDTTNVFASLTSRLTKELSLLGSWAYEERDDRTPKSNYILSSGVYYPNNPESMTTNRGKLEASYRLPQGYKLTAGYDYDQKKYKGLEENGYRDTMQEDTYRVDLRKSLGEVLNGSIILAHSDRSGSAWGSNTAATDGIHWIAPLQFSDRIRDKAKFMLDWSPLEAANIQFAYEASQDDYTTRKNDMGLNSGTSDLYSLDASYQLSDTWRANLWYSLSFNKIHQNERQNPRISGTPVQDCGGTAANRTCNPWTAHLNLKSEAVGFGLQGKVFGKMEVGAQYLYSSDRNKYDIAVGNVLAGVNSNSQVLAGAGILPDTVYNVSTLRLFGKYPVAKATTVRVDYIYDVRKMDDYTWAGWKFADGTSVFVKPEQTTQILGLTLIQSF